LAVSLLDIVLVDGFAKVVDVEEVSFKSGEGGRAGPFRAFPLKI